MQSPCQELEHSMPLINDGEASEDQSNAHQTLAIELSLYLGTSQEFIQFSERVFSGYAIDYNSTRALSRKLGEHTQKIEQAREALRVAYDPSLLDVEG